MSATARQCFADRLIDAIRARGTGATVNLDPVQSSLPKCYEAANAESHRISASAVVRDVHDYSLRVIRAIAPLVPVVKLNIAYFERFYGAGLDAYFDLIRQARDLGMIVIGDCKRGDVGHTAKMYAHGQLADSPFNDADSHAAPDAVTISGYFGIDGVKPFLEVCEAEGKGVFVLVRTSNESAAVVQDVGLSNGGTVSEMMASHVAGWAANSPTIGVKGYSGIGAVVATRHAQDAMRLRGLMPRSFFLVPGYGAQGGKAEDFVPYFKPDGTGALVAAGRSVIFAFGQETYRSRHGDDWESCVRAACLDFVKDLSRVAPVRS